LPEIPTLWKDDWAYLRDTRSNTETHVFFEHQIFWVVTKFGRSVARLPLQRLCAKLPFV